MYTSLSDIFFVDMQIIDSCLKIVSDNLNATEEEITHAIISLIPPEISMKKYSEKSFVVRAKDDSLIKKDLVKLGGSLNENLKGGPGYIYPMWAAKNVRKYIMGFGINNKRNKGEGEFRVTRTWDFDSVTSNFPFSNISEKEGIDGLRYRKLIPVPLDKSFLKEYFALRNSFEKERKYLPSEALYIVLSKFKKLERDEYLEVYTFYRAGKAIYWIKGRKDNVDKKIEDLFSEYPQNPYGSYFLERGSFFGANKEAFFYRGSGD